MDLPLPVDLGLLAFVAAVLNGAVGYGFSSVVTPVALFWVSNQLLNPSLVAVELGVNVVLLVRERRLIRATFPRARTVIVGLLPGVLLGTIGLVTISAVGVRLFVYLALLPLVLIQLIGWRRALRSETTTGPPVGAAVGFLYALTTISGPPLALYFRNQGLAKQEFRCAMAQVRVAEASMTCGAYLFAGLFTGPSLALVPVLLIPVVVGVPLGTLLLTRISRDFFSRVVMAVDAIIVTYGLYKVTQQVGWLSSTEALVVLVAILALTGFVAVRSVRRLPTLWARGEAKDAAPWRSDERLGAPPPEVDPP